MKNNLSFGDVEAAMSSTLFDLLEASDSLRKGYCEGQDTELPKVTYKIVSAINKIRKLRDAAMDHPDFKPVKGGEQ